MAIRQKPITKAVISGCIIYAPRPRSSVRDNQSRLSISPLSRSCRAVAPASFAAQPRREQDRRWGLFAWVNLFALNRSLRPCARKVDQCFLFFGFGVMGATRRFLGVLPVSLGSATTTFPIRSILDQKSSVDCRNSSAFDIGISSDYEAPLAAEPAPIDNSSLYKIAQSVTKKDRRIMWAPLRLTVGAASLERGAVTSEAPIPHRAADIQNGA
jgi:hypothetical protein